MESLEYPVETGYPRKRKINIKNRKQTIAKIQGYKRKNLPEMPKCQHKEKSGFKCKQLKPADALKFSDAFYMIPAKMSQDAFLFTYCQITAPKRTGRGLAKGSKQKFCVKYTIRTKKGLILKVCQKTFLNILGITKGRLHRVCSGNFETGLAPIEKRGGDKRSKQYDDKRNCVINFIKQFKTIEIHYCRSQISKRQYLPSELSIRKIWILYNEKMQDKKVRYSFFREIFVTKFNIGFKSPATDMCSTCISYRERMKYERDLKIKQELQTQLLIHKRRAKSFYDLLKEKKDGLLLISFDCQKNMPLPKLPDQAAYFSRQLYIYMFAIVEGTSKSALAKENTFLYYWTENCHAKGSNEIASSVFQYLNNKDMTGITTIRLMADGCGGQNKNSIMVGMCQYWLATKAPRHVKRIEIIFPIAGHSYLPADRVFAQIEKKVKAKETIVNVEEYLEIYSEFGTTKNLGSDDCPVYDFKLEIEKNCKPTGSWHFKFKESKRFYLTRAKNNSILVRGEVFYRSDIGVDKSTIKRGRNLNQIKLDRLPLGIRVNDLKLNDVDNLLSKHFGNEWKSIEQLNFYKNILNGNADFLQNINGDDFCQQQSPEINIIRV